MFIQIHLARGSGRYRQRMLVPQRVIEFGRLDAWVHVKAQERGKDPDAGITGVQTHVSGNLINSNHLNENQNKLIKRETIEPQLQKSYENQITNSKKTPATGSTES